MKPKEKQIALLKKLAMDRSVEREEVDTSCLISQKITLDEVACRYLDEVLGLSSRQKLRNKFWIHLRKRLREENHWKKAYKKGK